MAGTDDLRGSRDPDVVVGPGWYPDPFNGGQARWWDGQHWGPTPSDARDAGWWLANDGRYYPPLGPGAARVPGAPVGSPAPGVEAATPGKPYFARWWFWVLVAVSVPVVGIGLSVLGVLAQIGPDDYSSVYQEDFSTGAGEFDVWEEPQGSAAVIDGVYVMTNRNLGKSLTVGVRTPWSANRMRIDARMELTEAGQRDAFGLYLGRIDGQRYTFAVSPGGEARITGPGMECRGNTRAPGIRGGGLALSGEYDSAQAGGTSLTGYLDGRVLLTCVDEAFDPDSVGAFTDAGLWLHAEEDPVTARVDDVTITSYRY